MNAVIKQQDAPSRELQPAEGATLLAVISRAAADPQHTGVARLAAAHGIEHRAIEHDALPGHPRAVFATERPASRFHGMADDAAAAMTADAREPVDGAFERVECV